MVYQYTNCLGSSYQTLICVVLDFWIIVLVVLV